MQHLPTGRKALAMTVQALTSTRYWRYFVPSMVLAVAFGATTGGAAWLLSLAEAWKSIPVLGSLLVFASDALLTVWNFAFEFLVLTLLSPLNSYLSEKIDEDHYGFPFEFTLLQFVRAILRTAMVAVFALTAHLVLLVLLVVPSWLVGDAFSEGVAIAVNALFLGFAFFDYSLERHGYGVRRSLRWTRRNVAACFTVGVIFSAATYVPLLFDAYAVYYLGMGLLPPALTILATHWFAVVRQDKVG